MPDYSKPQVTFRNERVKGGLPALLTKLNDLEGVEWEPALVVAEAGDIVRAVVNDRPQKPEYFAQATPRGKPTVIDAVRDYMARNGYDALYRSDDGEGCGCCVAKGLAPCACDMPGDCLLGHWVESDNDGDGGARPGPRTA
ncbi:MAG: hypothetical protein PHX83_06570 [Acidobacteriia bacterium]|nr:hypothetical protein [Terriglobia bacterium]